LKILKKKSQRRNSSRKKSAPGGLWGRIPRILIGLLVVLGLVFGVSSLGALHKLDAFVHDTKMRLNHPPAESEVAVVIINDDDYRKLFKGKSPLDPFELQRIINAIALGKPRIIGVDIVNTDEQFRAVELTSWWPPIIWYRESQLVPPQEQAEHGAHNEQGLVEAFSVLGGKGPEYDANSGLPLLIEDAEDRVTRRYRRMIATTEGLLPSFPWAIVSKLPPDKARGLKASTDDLFIRYSLDKDGTHRFTPTASIVLELAKGGLPADNPFKDKIVLLGGSYLNADKHDTPIGVMNGVEILAQVVETELQGGGDKAPNKFTTHLLEIFEGAIAIILFQFFQRYRFSKALLLNLSMIFLTSLLCSYVAFGSPWRIAYFLPLLLLLILYEHIMEYRAHLIKILTSWAKPHQTK
jgi:CHASE2 domain-containing sensor protein